MATSIKDKVSKMSLAQETVQVNNNKRGFDIDLNVALSEEEENEIVEEEKSSVIVDSDEEESVTRNNRWETLIDVAEMKLREYEQKCRGKAQEKTLNRKKRVTTRTVDEFRSESTRYDDYGDCVVVRSTRGRAVALPNKYRDSVLEPVAEFPRVTRTGKRKSRLSSWNSK